MRKLLYTTLALTAWILGACEYETLPTYHGEPYIYFSSVDSSKYQLDSVYIHFGYDHPQRADSICKVRVRTISAPVDYDRYIRFELVDTASTALQADDIELLPDLSFIPAGKTNGAVAVRLKNSAHLQADGKPVTLHARIRLLENEHFKVDYATEYDGGRKRLTEYRFFFDNDGSTPKLWLEVLNCTRYFGTYSEKKMELIENVCHIGREMFDYDEADLTQYGTASKIYNARFPGGFVSAMCHAINVWLKEYKAANGTPYTEEDGTEMVLGERGAKL
ncbi:MAG: DUF4843 domain-containing protein [Mediterranea sp.]|jgi:hypothetical protein|nr:DUF4843 domain-containing protein [Mediterranea sp.]